MEKTTMQRIKEWVNSRSKLQCYALAIGVAIAIVLTFFSGVEYRHHHIRAATVTAYSALTVGCLTLAIYAALEIVRRTTMLRSYVESLLQLPQPHMPLGDVEKLYARNGRVLALVGLIERSLIDEYYKYIGAAMKSSDMKLRYPTVHSFWSKSIEYNSECANDMMKRYTAHQEHNQELMATILVDMRNGLSHSYEKLPVLCNLAYVAVHSENEHVRKEYKREYIRWRVTQESKGD